MTPLWNNILKSTIPHSRQRPADIATLLKKAIINNSLPLGSRFPSSREIGRHLKKSQTFMEAVWAILHLDHEAIITKSSRTYVALSVPQGRGKVKSNINSIAEPLDTRVFYDEDCITKKDTQICGLKLDLTRSCKKFEIIRTAEKSLKIHPGLITHFRSMANNLTAGSYGEEELIYMHNFRPF